MNKIYLLNDELSLLLELTKSAISEELENVESDLSRILLLRQVERHLEGKTKWPT